MHFKITLRRCYYDKCIKIAGALIAALICGPVLLVGKFPLALHAWNSLILSVGAYLSGRGQNLNNVKES